MAMRRLAPARLVAGISTAALLLALPGLVCRKALAQIPPPPIQVPTLTPTLTSPFQDAVKATVEGNEVIQSIMSARGSDPTKWFIPPKAMPELRPIALTTMPAMVDKLSALKAERKRLQLLLDADGVLNAIQGMSCIIGVQSNDSIERLQAGTTETDSEAEGGPADEIGSLSIALANVRKQIDEIEHSPEFAHRRYIACLRAAGVSIRDGESLPAAGEQRLYPHAARQTSPSVQAREFKDCSPRLENYTSHVLAPRMVGFNRANVAQYNWQWVTVTRSRMTKPDGC
jgi:hypothetical protein